MQIPLTDLQAQYRTIRREIDRAIQRVLDRGQFILGPEGAALERDVAAACGAREGIAVASGTDALELALRACGIGPGDDVLTSAFSFFATPEAILAVGARPVFVDIDPATCNLDPARLDAARTRRTRAVIPVHLYGHPCEMAPILAFARRHRLAVVEDCAQAIGARYRGRPVGSFGDAAALSFYPSKNLGAYGDGGMVVTNRPDVARRIRLLRAHGSRQQYRHLVVGTNSRLDELQAAILRVKLRRLARWSDARRRNARRYAAAFRRHGVRQVELPQEQPGCRSVYYLYTIQLSDRRRVQGALSRAGIATQVAYPSILPHQPALRRWVARSQRFPQAQEASRRVLSLPMYPELTARQIERVVGRIARCLA